MKLQIFSLLFTIAAITASNAYYRVCYFTNWAQYRDGDMKFMPSDIDPFLCTHIMYSFAKVTDDNKLGMYEWNDDTLYQEVSSQFCYLLIRAHYMMGEREKVGVVRSYLKIVQILTI